MNVLHGDAEHQHVAKRAQGTWALAAGVVHVALLLVLAFVVMDPGGSARLSAWVGLASLAALLLVARPILADNGAIRFALLIALVPSLATAVALHGGVERPFIVYALGASASSLTLSFLACVLALRACSRPAKLRFRLIGGLACAISAVGALAVLLSLPAQARLVLAGPLGVGVLVVAIIAATLDGQYAPVGRQDAPRAALDAVSASILALGAVWLAALATGALHVNSQLEAAGGALTEQTWRAGIDLLRRAAIAGLPIVGGCAVALAGSAERVGRGARAWGGQSGLVAFFVLLLVAGLRFELAAVSRAASDPVATGEPVRQIAASTKPQQPAPIPEPAPTPAPSAAVPVATTTADAPAEPAAAAVAAPTTGGVELRFEPLTVKGRMFPSEVQGRLDLLREKLAACADKAPNAALDHTVTLEFVISEQGGVVYVAPDSKSDLPEPIKTCMHMVLYHVGFPSPKRGSARVFAPIHIARASK